MKDQERREKGLYKINVLIPIELFLKIKRKIGTGQNFDTFVTEAMQEKFESLEENYAKISPKSQ